MKTLMDLTNKLMPLRLLILTLLTMSNQSFASESNSLTIGFGSCAHQKQPQAIWDDIVKHDPDLFILMGDNVYIDSADPKDMAAAYTNLSNNPIFTKFRKTTPLLATWDDHDYGIGDGGKSFIGKVESRKAFMKFFKYPELKLIEKANGGIFHTRWIDFNDKRVQIIMLDTRWYRDDLVKSYLTDEQRKVINMGPYQPTFNQQTTILGEEQWKWLEQELNKKADLRILVSSIQVLTEFSGWETWANFPHERIRLLDLLHLYDNGNTIILSGDIHRAEYAKINYKGQSILEFTSSGLAVRTYPAAVNKHRIGNAFEEKNYGILNIQDNGKLSVVATIYSDKGEQKLSAKLGE